MNLKRIGVIIVVIMALAVVLNITQILAFGSFDVSSVNRSATGTTEGMDSANNAIKRVWGTVSLILQILAVAAIVIAGIRYMFASADGKADIKKQTIFLIVGAILVFAASTIVSFIVRVTSEVTLGSSITINSDGSVSRTSDYDGDGVNDWDDTRGSGIPDILNPAVMDQKYYEQWKKDHPDDPVYK